jgi:hypothetical protein
MTFEYGNPEAILAEVLKGLPDAERALEAFSHFCSYTGCDPNNTWAKLAFLSRD